MAMLTAEHLKIHIQRYRLLFELTAIVIAACILTYSLFVNGGTYDERVHINRGIVFWRTAQPDFDPMHPPLVSILAFPIGLPKIEAAYHLRERLDGPVRTRLHKGGSQACDPGLVQAGAGEWAGRVRELSGDARSVDGGDHELLPGPADQRVCGGLQQPREGAQEAVLRDLQCWESLPTAHTRLAWIPTLRSYLTSRHLVANHGNSGRARVRAGQTEAIDVSR